LQGVYPATTIRNRAFGLEVHWRELVTIGQLRELLGRAFKRWNEDNATRLAASFAFYAILSFAPLLIFGIAIFSQFLDQGQLRETVLSQAREQLGSGASALVQTMIESANKKGANTIASLISLALALFGASGLFDQLNLSVNTIWRIGPKTGNTIRNYVAEKLVSVVMALVFLTLILAWLGIDSVISYMQQHTTKSFPLWPLISFAVSVLFLTGVFSVTFKALPRRMVQWKDVWLPAAVTAFGFGIAKYILSLYFGIGGVGAAYGPAGALVIILLWFYYASQIFFFGVELTFAYAYEFGSHKKEIAGELEMS
jgi:membrane protein